MRWLQRRISRRKTSGSRRSRIWTPDKDLAQCVRGDRVVQIDRPTQEDSRCDGVREKFGVDPALIPDFLALVGDAADGYPGIAGIGPMTAAQLLNRYGGSKSFPRTFSGNSALSRFSSKNSRRCAQMRRFSRKSRRCGGAGTTPAFAAWADRMEAPRLLERCEKAAADDFAL